MVQHPDSQVALQQAYCFVYGSMTHGMPGPQQAPLHGVSPVGPEVVQRRVGVSHDCSYSTDMRLRGQQHGPGTVPAASTARHAQVIRSQSCRL